MMAVKRRRDGRVAMVPSWGGCGHMLKVPATTTDNLQIRETNPAYSNILSFTIFAHM